MLELLFHELSDRTFDLLIVGCNLFLVLVIIVENFNKLPFSFIEGLLRQLHQVFCVILVLVATNLYNEDTNREVSCTH